MPTTKPATRRAKRTDKNLPHTRQQMIAGAAADALAEQYQQAEVEVGVEQAFIKFPGEGSFLVIVSRSGE